MTLISFSVSNEGFDYVLSTWPHNHDNDDDDGGDDEEEEEEYRVSQKIDYK